DYNAKSVSGALNLPLGDKFAVRIAGAINQRDGYITNILNGVKHSERDDSTIRASFLFKPTANIENTLILSHFESDTTTPGLVISAIDLTGSQAAGFGLGPAVQAAFARQQARDYYHIEVNQDGLSKAENSAVTNITTFDLGGVTLKNIFGFRKMKTRDLLDLDGTAAPVLETDQKVDVEQISNEVLLNGKALDAKLDWTVGGIYFREYGSDISDPTLLANGLIRTIGGAKSASNMNYGVFAQGEYEATDKLTLTAGLRYSWDSRMVSIGPTTNAPLFVLLRQAPNAGNAARVTVCSVTRPNPAPSPGRSAFSLSECDLARRADFQDLNYALSADYKLNDDSMVYIAHRRGYRSGGFNQRATIIEDLNTPFQPEIARDVEIGSKNKFDLGGGGTLRLNAAAFYVWVDDIQRSVQKFENNLLFTSVVNAASAKITGIEVDGAWSPNSSLTLSASYSLADASYDRFIAQTSGGATVDLSQNELSLAPKSSGSAAIDWRPNVNLGIGQPFFGLDVYTQSKFESTD
ncbi:MAG: TonB-dependent receptor, partial [Caulobacterales bacterium]